ncbi:hypothetical protein BGW38_000907 [Lunasporangiospora selenospora]|uniref:Uncharacterized protein n=1 Tax=Lunasporangiospora selenospora TaxID=979761 RepID=A0A9P6G2D1_9FUNG|nr:hypothetical protein BGW38_000907 [Lunasporangiospora selenospora]
MSSQTSPNPSVSTDQTSGLEQHTQPPLDTVDKQQDGISLKELKATRCLTRKANEAWRNRIGFDSQKGQKKRYEYEITQRLIQDMETDLQRLLPAEREDNKSSVPVLDTLPKHVARYDGKKQTARTFLSQFRRLMIAHLGEEQFERQCERLMVSCIEVEHYAVQFQEDLNLYPEDSRG